MYLVSRWASRIVELVGTWLPHPFRMKLQAHYELALLWIIRIWVVEPFDQSIRRESHRNKPVGQPLHTLMVVAVHHELHLSLLQ